MRTISPSKALEYRAYAVLGITASGHETVEGTFFTKDEAEHFAHNQQYLFGAVMRFEVAAIDYAEDSR